MAMDEDVVIAGGGIAGLATAVALKRVGIRALVLESADGLRASGAALTLFPNAWLALDALGVSHKLTSIYSPCQKGYFTNLGTGVIQEVSFSQTNSPGSGPRSVHRKALLKALAEELPTDTIRYSSKLTSVETQTQEGSTIAIIRIEDGTIIKAKILIGCDGVHSVVGRWLGLTAPVDSGRFGIRGLAVFPQGHKLKHEVQQFIDVGKRAGFVPLTDKELYWFLTCKSTIKDQVFIGDQEMAGDPESIKKEVLDNFAKDFPSSYIDMVVHADLSTLSVAPLMFRFPWAVLFGNLSKGNITVAGDAMHPMTPDLGQGGCSSLEDAVVLGQHIGESFIRNGGLVPGEVVKAIEGYVKERRWRAAALITGSYLSGWVQQGGSSWWMKFLRDFVYYKLLFPKVLQLVQYDTGKLPSLSTDKLDNQQKLD